MRACPLPWIDASRIWYTTGYVARNHLLGGFSFHGRMSVYETKTQATTSDLYPDHRKVLALDKTRRIGV